MRPYIIDFASKPQSIAEVLRTNIKRANPGYNENIIEGLNGPILEPIQTNSEAPND